MTERGTAAALLRSCHPGPCIAVTLLTVLLAAGSGLGPGRTVLVAGTVLAGQLGIGWSNDLIDLARDREVGRTDKPLAGGELDVAVVRRAITASLLATLVLSLACGPAAGLVHLLLVVGGGWAYNALLKRTVLSAAPYAVAFGALPAVVLLTGDRPVPAWMVVAGALLGVGAHLLNALPDLADDAATGVVGLPHRLGARRVRLLAPLVLLAASVVATLGPGVPADALAWLGLTVCLGLAGVALTTRGRIPFLAAVGIALVDVLRLVLRG